MAFERSYIDVIAAKLSGVADRYHQIVYGRCREAGNRTYKTKHLFSALVPFICARSNRMIPCRAVKGSVLLSFAKKM